MRPSLFSLAHPVPGRPRRSGGQGGGVYLVSLALSQYGQTHESGPDLSGGASYWPPRELAQIELQPASRVSSDVPNRTDMQLVR